MTIVVAPEQTPRVPNDPSSPESAASQNAALQRSFPAAVGRPWGRPRGARHRVGHFERTAQFVIDTRDEAPDRFDDESATDWSSLTWKDIGRPYSVEKWSGARKAYEASHDRALPVADGWRLFNTAFHQFFLTDVPEAQRAARAKLTGAQSGLDAHDAQHALEDMLRLAVWNKIMRVEDAVWDLVASAPCSPGSR